MSKTKSIIIAFTCFFYSHLSSTVALSADLEIPRFVSLKHNQSFARKGPGKQYPIGWVYNRKALPVEIVLEYTDWRKVKDSSGELSWMHKSQLSGKRTALVLPNNSEGYTLLYKDKAIDSKILARLQNELIVSILKCESNWCQIQHGDFTGWTQRKSLWGIYPRERID